MTENEVEGRITFGTFLAVYLGTVIVGIGLVPLAAFVGIDPWRALLGYFTCAFAVAGLKISPTFFQVLRSVGWFALIPSDRFMQGFLLALAAFFLVGAVLG